MKEKDKQIVFKDGAELIEFIKGLKDDGIGIYQEFEDAYVQFNEDKIKMAILQKFFPEVMKTFNEVMDTFKK